MPLLLPEGQLQGSGARAGACLANRVCFLISCLQEEYGDEGDLIDDRGVGVEQAARQNQKDQARFRQINREHEEKSAEELAAMLEERYRGMTDGYEDVAMGGAVGQQVCVQA